MRGEYLIIKNQILNALAIIYLWIIKKRFLILEIYQNKFLQDIVQNYN